MDYEKKYKEALERAQSLYNSVRFKSDTDAVNVYNYIETIFPELKENEDEYMMDSILSDIEGLKERTRFPVNKEAYDDEINWLKSIKKMLKGE